MLNKLLDGRDEGEGELGENLVFTSHQLIFRSRLFTLSLSAELLGEQGGVGSYSWGAAVTVQEEWGAAAGGVSRAAATSGGSISDSAE